MGEILNQLWNLPSVLTEKCGVILMNGLCVELPNTALDPLDNFRIDPQDLAPYEAEVVAFWHTHPRTSANLSDSDYQTFLNYPQQLHYIVTPNRICEYNVLSDLVYMRNIYERSDVTIP